MIIERSSEKGEWWCFLCWSVNEIIKLEGIRFFAFSILLCTEKILKWSHFLPLQKLICIKCCSQAQAFYNELALSEATVCFSYAALVLLPSYFTINFFSAAAREAQKIKTVRLCDVKRENSADWKASVYIIFQFRLQTLFMNESMWSIDCSIFFCVLALVYARGFCICVMTGSDMHAQGRVRRGYK